MNWTPINEKATYAEGDYRVNLSACRGEDAWFWRAVMAGRPDLFKASSAKNRAEAEAAAMETAREWVDEILAEKAMARAREQKRKAKQRREMKAGVE